MGGGAQSVVQAKGMWEGTRDRVSARVPCPLFELVGRDLVCQRVASVAPRVVGAPVYEAPLELGLGLGLGVGAGLG